VDTHSAKPYILIVDEDVDYLVAAKERLEKALPESVIFVADGAVQAMQTVHDVDRSMVFLIKYGLHTTDSQALVKHIKKVFRFSSFFYFLLETKNERLKERVLDFGVEPLEKYLSGRKWNFGREFIARVRYGMDHVNKIHLDPLTGLYTRETGLDIWKRDFIRARRKREAIGCLYIDIDDFSNVNDTYGHLAGDEVLRALSQVLLGCIRNSFDTAVRLSEAADEFFLIFQDVNQVTFREIKKRVIAAVEGLTIRIGRKKLHLGISVGAYLLLPDYMGKDPIAAFEMAMKKSDRKMYKEKRLRKGKKLGLPS
jgi:diguanylate cyclase (GGDEF)-like protein